MAKKKKKTSQKKNNTTTKQQCTAHNFKTDSSASSKNHYPHPFNDPGAIIVLETRMETSSSIPPPRFLLILQWLLQFSGRCAREVEARGDSSRCLAGPSGRNSSIRGRRKRIHRARNKGCNVSGIAVELNWSNLLDNRER